MIKILSHVVLAMVIIVLLSGCDQTTADDLPGYPIINSVNLHLAEKYVDVNIDFPGNGTFTKIYYVSAWYITQGESTNNKIDFEDNHNHYSSKFSIKSFNGFNNLPANSRVFINIDAISEWTVTNPDNPNYNYTKSLTTYESWLWVDGVTTRLNHTESN